MSVPAGFYGSRVDSNAGSSARSGEYCLEDFVNHAANIQDGDRTFPNDICDAFIRQQQELIPGVME